METGLRLQAFDDWLSELPIDVSGERSYLAAALNRGKRAVIAIAGDAAAGPYALLGSVTGERPFTDGEPLPCAVECRYGSAYSIAAATSGGEVERFYSAADFNKRFANRYHTLSACRIEADAPVLENRTLQFLLLNDDTARRLDAPIGACSGCIVMLPSDGGALSEPVRALCAWIAARGYGSHTAILVSHAERRFQNKLLPSLARAVLHAELCPVYYAAQKAESDRSPVEAVSLACSAFAEWDAEALTTADIQYAAARVHTKLTPAIASAQAARAEAERLASITDALAIQFRAEAETDRYALEELLSGDEIEEICADIRGMLRVLGDNAGELMRPVLERSEDPKQDIRCLGGEYLGALIHDYFTALVTDLDTNVLMPRMEKLYARMQARFLALVTHADLPSGFSAAYGDAMRLRMADVNLGAFVPPVAEWTNTAVCLTLYTLGLVLGGNLGRTLRNLGILIEGEIEKLITRQMSPAAYAKAFAERAQYLIEQSSGAIVGSFHDIVLPRLHALMLERYLGRVAQCCDRMRAAAGEYQRQADAAREEAALLAERKAWLENSGILGGRDGAD